MALKSYRFTKKSKKKKRKNGLITGAVGALIGVAIVAETASALSRL